MNAFQKLSNIFRKEKDNEAHYVGGTRNRRGDLSEAVVTPVDGKRFDTFAQAYSAIPELFYSARLPGRLISSQSVEVTSVYRFVSNTNKLQKSGPLYDLINKPHPIYSFQELIYRCWILKKVFGFAVLARETLAEGTYWTVLNPKNCTLVADPRTKFTAIKYEIGSVSVYYAASDFILFEEFNIEDFYYGLSAIGVGDLDAQLLLYGKRSTTSNYKLGDPPQIALRVKNVGPEEIENIKREMSERTPEHGRMLIFSEKHFEIHDTSTKGGKNTTGLDASRYGANNIALTMDVPPSILSDTTKEYRESLEFLYITTVIPGIKEVQAKINNYAKQNNLNQQINFLYKKDLIVARILLDLGKTLASLISSGVLTINEAREFLDYEGLPSYEDKEREFPTIDFGNLPKPVFDALTGNNSSKVINENGTAPGSQGGRNKTD